MTSTRQYLIGTLLLILVVLSGCISGGGGSYSSGNSAQEPNVNGLELQGLDETKPFVQGQTLAPIISLLFDDGSSKELPLKDVTWVSADTSVVEVLLDGRLRALQPGTTTVKASYADQNQIIQLVVVQRRLMSLSIETPRTSLAKGTSVAIQVFGIYNDNTQSRLTAADGIVLVSSAPSLLTLNDQSFGSVRGTSIGTATLTAFDGAELEGSVNFIIGAAELKSMVLSADQLSRPAGLNISVTALGTFTDESQQDISNDVDWSVEGIAGAMVNNTGLVSAKAPGVLTVTAAGNGLAGFLELTFLDAQLQGIQINSGAGTIPLGRSQRLELKGNYTDGSKQDIVKADWASSDETVASVNNAGQVQGHAIGTSVVSAAYQGFTASVGLQVTAAVLDTLSVTFSNSNNSAIPVGLEAQAIATGTFTDGSTEDFSESVAWTIQPSDIASVGSMGKVSGRQSGVGTVTAVYQGVTGSIAIEITDAIVESVRIASTALIDGQLTRAKGLQEPVQLLGAFSDGNELALPTDKVTWSIGNPAIATVTADSKVQFLNVGTSTLDGRYLDFVDTIQISTTDAIPVAITINGAPAEMGAGTSVNLTATLVFSDGTEQVITDDATWTSSNPELALVLEGAGQSGQVNAFTPGILAINAELTRDGFLVNGFVSIEVVPSVLVVELYSDGGFFSAAGFSRCGSSDGTCTFSSSSSLQILPRPEWFTLDTFRLVAQGRDWTVEDIFASTFSSINMRVVGVHLGDVIPKGESIRFDVQIQPTNGTTVNPILTLDVVGNGGTSVRVITGFYSIRTN